MSWIHHPKYVPIRDELVENLRTAKIRTSSLSPVVFICGAQGSKPRDALRSFLRKHHPDLQVFYAEQIWDSLTEEKNTNALSLESDLADLSDLIIIVVESPGTFTEVGAFSSHEELRKKLLLFVGKQYEGVSSFLETGPIRWINHDSKFGKAIYTNLPTILEAAGELSKRIDLLPKKKPELTDVSKLRAKKKELVFFLSDLLTVIGPAPLSLIKYFATTAICDLKESEVETYVRLGEAVGINKIYSLLYSSGKKKEYFAASDMSHSKLSVDGFDYHSERAKHMSVLLDIPEALTAIGLADPRWGATA